MLKVRLARRHENCEGSNRRDFLKVGTLGLTGFGLADLLRARAAAAQSGSPVADTSVVWVWLGGGPTHVETFDPKMTAPEEYRSVTGEVSTVVPGITLGGQLVRMAQAADKMAFVRSFAHSNSGHGGGTHFVMTGYDNRTIDNGGLPSRPAMGAIVSRYRGANHWKTGMPTYIGLGGIGADGPAFLGTAFAAFRPSGQARTNMDVKIDMDRLEDRRQLLSGLDRINRQIDRSGLMDGLDRFEQQAYSLVLGEAPKAFDVSQEDPRVVASYGPGLGAELLRARRLCEAGAGFVTLQYGGWDMHGQIKSALDRRMPQLDQAVAAFVEDVHARGQSGNILLVITGEFGRTPKINHNAGRDHWAPLSTLALAGGGLRMGQTVGQSAEKVDVPKSTPIGPQDLMATIFHVLGMPLDLQYVNPFGRPTNMIENGRPIAELV